VIINIFFVGLGGFIGAVCRYLASLGIQHLLGEKTPWMPLGTLFVNIVGCFVIGLLEGLAANRALFADEIRLLVFVGVLGGFTTFSAFGFEAYTLLDNKQTGAALAHIGLHLAAGLGAVYLGILVSRIGQ
jgi:CrcB protein